MRSRWPVYLILFTMAVACAGARTRPRGGVDFDTAEMTHGIAYRLFPELGPVDPSYRWLGGSVPVDPAAPLCAPAAPPPASWRVERVDTHSQFLDSLEVTLPPELAGTGRTQFGVDTSAETLGGVLAASWGQATPSPVGERGSLQVSAWVGPEDGYPTIGADTASRQLYGRQCRMRTADGERFMTEFALRDPRGSESYLGAVWPIMRGRYLRVLITGLDSASVADARVVVASMRGIARSGERR